ncbi:MAG TPA: ABC transporter permease [Gemmatimonadaceae bacterium]|nr:ABC transporter permease [Gemmatimonadaceae bacterium]
MTPPARAPGEWAYRLLLRLYPAAFRDAFAEDMAEFFRDRCRAEMRRRGAAAGALAAWSRALGDLVLHAPLARLDALRARAAVPNDPHAQRPDPMLRTLLQDARYAVRGMLQRPAFTAIVLATLALGIGANAAIFSVVNGVLLQPLPFEDPRRIAQVRHSDAYSSLSEPEFADYRRDARAFSRVSAYSGAPANLTGGDAEPERVRVARVSDGFFAVLGVRPLLGRAFLPEEDKPRAPTVLILSHGLWQRRYGGDPAIVGKEIMVNGVPRTVVGVMPPRFGFPAADVDLYAPLRLNYDTLWTRNNHYLNMIARLAPGATVERASAELNAMTRRWMTDYPETYFPDKPISAIVVPVPDDQLGKTRPYLYALLGAVAFVLLIACVNVANLMLARGESRQKELAIRVALGASRARIARQVLTESALFALLGGGLGLLIAWQGVRLLLALAPEGIPRLDEVRVDLPVLLFTLGVSLATGALFGAVPALRGARRDAGDALKEGGKTSGQGRTPARTRRALVISEIALAVVTLAGSGLMLRSLWKLRAVDLGFQPRHVLTMRVSPPPSEYRGDRAVQFYRQLTARVAATPGVRAVGAVNDLPIADGFSGWSIMVDGRVVSTIAEAPVGAPQQVTPGYFQAMGMTLLRGRAFAEADRADSASGTPSPLVAVVNETMAKRYWPGRDAVGGTLKMFGTEWPWVTVVGVVKDVRSAGVEGEVPPTMYFPHAQSARSAYVAPSGMTLVVRTSGEPEAVAGAVRAAVRTLEPNAPVSRIRSMEEVVAASLASRRFSTLLISAFAGLALVLAAIGIYGVISYSVTERTFEIGLRMALGAERGSVLRLVLVEGLRVSAIGLAVGLTGAIVLTRLLRSMLVGVSATDPATLAAVAALLAAVALAASYLPARRAMGVEPMRVMRGE